MTEPITTELALRFGTDKGSHGYMPFYAELITSDPFSMLEIGIARGASAKMWRHLFPYSAIDVMDLYEDPEHLTTEQVIELGCQPLKANQGNFDDVRARTTERYYSLIIDDGSHNAHHQWISLAALWDRLFPGGWYVIEDLHCNVEDFYWDEKFIRHYHDTPKYLLRTKEVKEGAWEIITETMSLIKRESDQIVFGANNNIVAIQKCL
jgi:cephalosporin hydroxylase